jgi:hypothetical protein
MGQVNGPEHHMEMREHQTQAQDDHPEPPGAYGNDGVKAEAVGDTIEEDAAILCDGINVVPGTGNQPFVSHSSVLCTKMGIIPEDCNNRFSKNDGRMDQRRETNRIA